MSDIGYGGGEFDVLLDCEGQALAVYNGGEDFHSRYGGKQYYESRSGLSGRGSIQWRLDRIVVQGYRTETETPLPTLTPIGGGLEVGIPTVRDGIGAINPAFPALIRRAGELVICHCGSLWEALGGKAGVSHEYTFEFFAAAGTDLRTCSVHYAYLGPEWWAKKNRRNVHAVLRELHPECRFRPDGTPGSLPFWTRLGLHWQADGNAYKIAKGVCRRRYTPAYLETQEKLQDAAPANVRFLTNRHYLQLTRDGEYEAVGISECRRYDFEAAAPPDLAMRAMMGEGGDLIAEIDRRIERKVAVDRAASAGIDELTAAIAANAAGVVTMADAIAAGACLPGIERFRDQHFPGRDTVTVGELAAHISDRDVERVIRHTLFGGCRP